jgi:hypothetical protein
LTKLEITPPSLSNHSRYGTDRTNQGRLIAVPAHTVTLKLNPHFRRQVVLVTFKMLLNFVPDCWRSCCDYPVDELAPD